jgi:hypothetical protein
MRGRFDFGSHLMYYSFNWKIGGFLWVDLEIVLNLENLVPIKETVSRRTIPLV